MITTVMRQNARRIPAKEAAQIVRKYLKHKYPGIKFFVQTRHHTSINVHWMDGPSSDEITAACDVGSVFGVDMTDYAYSGYHWLNPDNSVTPAYCQEWEGNPHRPHPKKPHPRSELVMFYSRYFGAHRVLSKERAEELANETQINDHPYTFTAYDWQPGRSAKSKIWGQYYQLQKDWGVWESEHQVREFRRLVRERSFYTAPSKNGSRPKAQVNPVEEITITHEGDWTWIQFPAKPDKETREVLGKLVKARWSGKRGAWYVREIVTPESVLAILGEVIYEEAPAPKQEKPDDKPAGNPKLAARMRKTADNMSKTIEAKFTPGVAQQNPTPRRARIAAGMRADGERLQKEQAVLYALADMQEAGTIPAEFAHLTSKKAVQDNFYQMREELKPLYTGSVNQEDKKQRQIDDKIKAALFSKIEGYFPTPDAVIDKMLDYVHIEEGTKALEPSAGSGAIADKMRERGADVDICETSSALREILDLKGYTLNGYDFLEHTKEGYEVIVMNPPFEKGQDIYHVLHAYNLLEPGCSMVSIMSEGVFFRNDKKARGFIFWLDSVGGWSEKLPEGSFKESGTGVNTRMVVIDKSN